jgi:type IV pilus assembly protein PilB
MKFGEFLVSLEVVKSEDILKAIKVQKYLKKPVGRLLRDQGHMDDKYLDQLLGEYHGGITDQGVDDIVREIEQGKKHDEIGVLLDEGSFIQISFDEFRIKILSTQYKDNIAEQIQNTYGIWAEFVLVTQESFDYVCGKINPTFTRSKNEITIRRQISDSERLESGDAYTKLFKDCISAAKEKGISDIHIEPDDDGLRIRFRYLGDCFLWKKLERVHKQSFINAVKKLSNLPISVSGVPKDSRISLKKLDIRVSSLPTIEGEKIVLRLLDKDRSFSISDSGFHPSVIEAYQNAITYKNGLILLSGATSSGKTSTLYSLLSSLDREKLNIVTVENPVEYTFRGIHQVDVSEKVSFNDALRAILRQDPDVILVGEVRDKETAQLCFQAAATGHLVFSSIHTNGAADVVGRLEHIGIDRQTIRENLRYSFSQRLLKKLCQNCSTSLQNGARIAGQGCSSCDLGYVGRVPIVEYMNEQQINSYLEDQNNLNYGLSFKEAINQEALAGNIDSRWAELKKEKVSA